AYQVQAHAHRSRCWAVTVAATMAFVRRAESLRYQSFHAFAHELARLVAEHRAQLLVDNQDSPPVVHNRYAVGCGIEQGPKIEKDDTGVFHDEFMFAPGLLGSDKQLVSRLDCIANAGFRAPGSNVNAIHL